MLRPIFTKLGQLHYLVQAIPCTSQQVSVSSWQFTSELSRVRRCSASQAQISQPPFRTILLAWVLTYTVAVSGLHQVGLNSISAFFFAVPLSADSHARQGLQIWVGEPQVWAMPQRPDEGLSVKTLRGSHVKGRLPQNSPSPFPLQLPEPVAPDAP